jgi:rSAM/selenodomain-associated transferase 1
VTPAQVVVMAKYPSVGAVKTRLGEAIGAEAACEVYAAFIADLARRLPACGLPVTWAFWPADAPFASLVAGSVCIAQTGRDLGERVAGALDACSGGFTSPAIAIGVDAPHLAPERLREAAAALSSGADLVLGPAADGGYYLIGLRRPCAAVFRGIAWGTSTVLDTTLVRARAAGLRHRLLPPTFDVDDLDGLRTLRGLIARGEVELPATAAVLRTLPAV